MGFYSDTYLCNGKFDGNNPEIVDKLPITAFNPIITFDEWIQKEVSFDELKRVLKTNDKFDNISFEEIEDNDIFLEEVEWDTYSNGSSSRYIIVKKNMKFNGNGMIKVKEEKERKERERKRERERESKLRKRGEELRAMFN